MTQASSKLLTVDEFIAQYGDDDRYELMIPTGLATNHLPNFGGSDSIVSATLPELMLTAAQVFASADR